MAHIDPEWTREQQALVMADEAFGCVVKSYNELVKQYQADPNAVVPLKDVLKTLKFAASHSQAVKDYYVRAAVPEAVWALVDEDARKLEKELEEIVNGGKSWQRQRKQQQKKDSF